MIIISWNCRGLGNAPAIRSLVHWAKIELLRVKFALQGAFSVDRMGRGEVGVGSVARWCFTGYYGYPERKRRRATWTFICHLQSISTLLWCLMGDFNELLNVEDKRGVSLPLSWLLNG
ncbi:conserved hypothetical protein [Ricinus communis]|uniref:Endonuclease/exonuclease/phosphatase domain-containing protein n=1 Tax=Ricinus communis TaxID=3988 RepID=B9RFW0_RICCO|nr:conserved hypothetical protein [Ricinus communis]EEF22752.1 conserved hypothetical protein [Ricinus communis]EEF50081.1 conserved hypothetical protein [Ricinus communis]